MYQVTLLNKSSETEVNLCLGLLEDNFGNGLEYYRWKHNIKGNYDIEEYTFCIFKDSLCIATLQVIINQMYISGEVNRFALLSDGATHTDYRRLGLFEQLLSYASEFCAKKEISFIYGSGNNKSRKAFLKLGFEDYFISMKASKRVRYTHPTMKVYNLFFNVLGKLSKSPKGDIRELSINEYATFFSNQKNKYLISYEKSEGYLKWRLDETTGNYKILGAFDDKNELQAIVVLKTSSNLMFIVDTIFKDDDNYLDPLLKYTYSLAIKNKNIIKINCVHNNFNGFKDVFERNNFKITKANSSSLLYVLNPDFKVPHSELKSMHYMRIDKNE